MGYTTNFEGRFNLNKKLTDELMEELHLLHEERHDDGDGFFPSLYCQWRPTSDGMGIEWDRRDKFYEYMEWLTIVIEMMLDLIMKEELHLL